MSANLLNSMASVAQNLQPGVEDPMLRCSTHCPQLDEARGWGVGRRAEADFRPLTSGSRSGSVKGGLSTLALWESKWLSLAQWSPVRAGRMSATARLFSRDAR